MFRYTRCFPTQNNPKARQINLIFIGSFYRTLIIALLSFYFQYENQPFPTSSENKCADLLIEYSDNFLAYYELLEPNRQLISGAIRRKTEKAVSDLTTRYQKRPNRTCNLRQLALGVVISAIRREPICGRCRGDIARDLVGQRMIIKEALRAILYLEISSENEPHFASCFIPLIHYP